MVEIVAVVHVYMFVTGGLHTQREAIMWSVPLQIKGSSGLLNKLTLTGEDSDFLLRRQQALEVRISGPGFYNSLPNSIF